MGKSLLQTLDRHIEPQDRPETATVFGLVLSILTPFIIAGYLGFVVYWLIEIQDVTISSSVQPSGELPAFNMTIVCQAQFCGLYHFYGDTPSALVCRFAHGVGTRTGADACTILRQGEAANMAMCYSDSPFDGLHIDIIPTPKQNEAAETANAQRANPAQFIQQVGGVTLKVPGQPDSYLAHNDDREVLLGMDELHRLENGHGHQPQQQQQQQHRQGRHLLQTGDKPPPPPGDDGSAPPPPPGDDGSAPPPPPPSGTNDGGGTAPSPGTGTAPSPGTGPTPTPVSSGGETTPSPGSKPSPSPGTSPTNGTKNGTASSPSPAATPTPTPNTDNLCGNGQVEDYEACDDGNSNNRDGCSNTCTIEQGYTCDASGCSQHLKESKTFTARLNIELFAFDEKKWIADTAKAGNVSSNFVVMRSKRKGSVIVVADIIASDAAAAAEAIDKIVAKAADSKSAYNQFYKFTRVSNGPTDSCAFVTCDAGVVCANGKCQVDTNTATQASPAAAPPPPPVGQNAAPPKEQQSPLPPPETQTTTVDGTETTINRPVGSNLGDGFNYTTVGYYFAMVSNNTEIPMVEGTHVVNHVRLEKRHDVWRMASNEQNNEADPTEVFFSLASNETLGSPRHYCDAVDPAFGLLPNGRKFAQIRVHPLTTTIAENKETIYTTLIAQTGAIISIVIYGTLGITKVYRFLFNRKNEEKADRIRQILEGQVPLHGEIDASLERELAKSPLYNKRGLDHRGSDHPSAPSSVYSFSGGDDTTSVAASSYEA